jgi:hypothetical protein
VSDVVYADAAPGGLASMLGGLIEQNLARDPGRRRLLRSAVYTIEATDAAVAVTLHVDPGGVRVADGPDPAASVRVRADSARLLEIAGVPLLFGFPDVFTGAGRSVLADIVRGRVRIGGLVRHPRLVSRLTLLLSAR